MITKGLKPVGSLHFNSINELARESLSDIYCITGLTTLCIYNIKNLSGEYRLQRPSHKSKLALLWIQNDQLSDQDMIEVTKHKNLIDLTIQGGHYTLAGLGCLSNLSHLKRVWLNNITIENTIIDNIKPGSQKMEIMERLSISNSKFVPGFSNYLEQICILMPNLTSLGLSDIDLTPSDLNHISNLEKVTTLSLRNCGLTSVNSLHFENMPSSRVFIRTRNPEKIQS